jgi:16S rRNA (guanine1207-N2)-methyltransferase
MSKVDQVIRLVLANSPERETRLALIDAPELAQTAIQRGTPVRAWCDDWNADQQVPTPLKPNGEDLPSLPDASVFGQADLVWMRLPKSLAGLDEYASLIAQAAAPEVTVVAFGRHQDLNRSMNDVLSRHFADVHASLGVGKYRALIACGSKGGSAQTWPRPRRHEDFSLTLWAHGETFAANRIDNGTRLLLDHLDSVPGGDVLDLAAVRVSSQSCLGGAPTRIPR